MTDKAAQDRLDWGWEQVVTGAGPSTSFEPGCREWFATFFLQSALDMAADPRLFRAAKRNFKRKLRFMGEYLRGEKDVTGERLDEARQAMIAALGGTIYCDPRP